MTTGREPRLRASIDAAEHLTAAAAAAAFDDEPLVLVVTIAAAHCIISTLLSTTSRHSISIQFRFAGVIE